MDHFPGFPIVPGVLQIEMMAATGGKVIKLAKPEWLPVLGTVKNAKFYRNVLPGDQCQIHVHVVRLRSTLSLVEAYIEVDGKKVSQAQLGYAIMSAEVIEKNYVDPVIADWKARNLEPSLMVSHEPASLE